VDINKSKHFQIGDLVRCYELRGKGIVADFDHDGDPVIIFFKELNRKQPCYKKEIYVISKSA